MIPTSHDTKEGAIAHSTSQSEARETDSNLDVAAKYANYFTGQDSYTQEEWRRLRWKIDKRLVPLLWFNATLGAMDKVSTGYAVLYGFREDTQLHGDRYSWVGSAFYCGYLLWSLPGGTLLQRFPIAKLFLVLQLIWGIVQIAIGCADNFGTLIGLRILLGALEAPLIPGNLLIIGMWYTRNDQPIRTGLMYTGLSVLLTGPIAWAIGFIPGDHQWRVMFWITGGITVAWAIIIGLLMPDNPPKARFVTERQKAILVDRLREDRTGVENKRFKLEQLIETLVDPKTWLMFLFHIFISIPNGGMTNFAPLIIKGLGWTSQQSTLLMMPTGIVQTVSSYACNIAVFLCIKYYPQKQTRVFWVVIGIIVGMIATIFLYTLRVDDYKGRLAALYLSYFYLGPFVVSLGINTANTAGHTKKVTTNALIFIAYCASNIVAPQFFLADQAPLYSLGIAAILGSYVLAMVTITLYAVYCWWLNKRNKLIAAAILEGTGVDNDYHDLTDKQNIHFRYVW